MKEKQELRRVVVKPFDKDKFEVFETYFYKLERDGDLMMCLSNFTRLHYEPEENVFFIVIPAGYKTNGADIPRIFWSIYPPNSPEYLTAVVIHDYLCEKSKTRQDYKYADIVFASVLRLLGVNKFKIWVFYTACDLYHGFKFLFKGEG